MSNQAAQDFIQRRGEGRTRKREETKQLSKTFSCITDQVMTQFRPSQKRRRNGDQILSLTEDGKALYI